MEDNIFRKKSLDRVSSPEQLDTYLKVTSPSVWLVLSAIIVLLFGVIVWGYFGTIETKVDSVSMVYDGVATCCIKEEDFLKVKEGMELRIEDSTYTIETISEDSFRAENILSSSARQLLGIAADDNVFIINVLCDKPNGTYEAKIITENISPLKFVFN